MFALCFLAVCKPLVVASNNTKKNRLELQYLTGGEGWKNVEGMCCIVECANCRHIKISRTSLFKTCFVQKTFLTCHKNSQNTRIHNSVAINVWVFVLKIINLSSQTVNKRQITGLSHPIDAAICNTGSQGTYKQTNNTLFISK